MSDLKPIHGALILALGMTAGCMCKRSFNIGPGGSRVDFQSCPPREVSAAVSDFESELGKRPASPGDSQIRAEAFTLLGRIQRLVDKPSNSRTPGETRQQVESALVRLRELPASKP
ncbi:MAG TPA: hypothetical protein VJV78_00840 [Polyangiales bacterium]|nr:hypothetical protein [Polyangiales bacterium]